MYIYLDFGLDLHYKFYGIKCRMDVITYQLSLLSFSIPNVNIFPRTTNNTKTEVDIIIISVPIGSQNYTFPFRGKIRFENIILI